MSENTSDFMLDMRRSTRISLRVAVRISVRESTNKTFDAWTVIVNIHGAKFECARPFAVGEEIGIATFTGKLTKAKVVWTQSGPNSEGNFEFAAEMEKPEILFKVANPPEDWKE